MDNATAYKLKKVIQREASLDNPDEIINFIDESLSDSKPKNLTIKQFCLRLPCSRATADKYIRLGKIQTIRVGRRVLISSIEFNRVAVEGLS